MKAVSTAPERQEATKQAGLSGGFYVMFAGEWKKILRGLKRVHGGADFIALPTEKQDAFFRRLVLIAHLPPYNPQIQKALKNPDLELAAANVISVRLKMIQACQKDHPEVTDFALRRLKERIRKIGKQSPDYWFTMMTVTPPSSKKFVVPAAARKAMWQLRKAAQLVEGKKAVAQTDAEAFIVEETSPPAGTSSARVFSNSTRRGTRGRLA